MRVNRNLTTLFRAAALCLAVLLGACQKSPEAVSDSRYQRQPQNQQQSPAVSKPVQQLHNQALAAINEDRYAEASDYLQRAIRIQPRNGWSWYYLADIDWRQGRYESCRSLLDRADSYASGDAELVGLSAQLRTQCQ